MDAFIRRIRKESPHLAPALNHVLKEKKPETLEELKERVDEYQRDLETGLGERGLQIEKDRELLLRRLRGLNVGNSDSPAPFATDQDFNNALKRSTRQEATTNALMALNNLSLLILGELVMRKMGKKDEEK